MLEIDDDLRELIKTRAAKRAYREKIRAAGLVPLREAAVRKAKAGITSLEEVLRVT
jgi:general secretion pathway protein E/type IV pilus assembly protein PilB